MMETVELVAVWRLGQAYIDGTNQAYATIPSTLPRPAQAIKTNQPGRQVPHKVRILSRIEGTDVRTQMSDRRQR